LEFSAVFQNVKMCMYIFVNFLHGLGRLPLFSGAYTISSSSRIVVEGVFLESGVVHSFKMVDPVFLCLDLTSCIPDISSSFLMTSLLILSSLVYHLTLLRKRISAASRRVMSRVVVTNVSLSWSSVGLAKTKLN